MSGLTLRNLYLALISPIQLIYFLSIIEMGILFAVPRPRAAVDRHISIASRIKIFSFNSREFSEFLEFLDGT